MFENILIISLSTFLILPPGNSHKLGNNPVGFRLLIKNLFFCKNLETEFFIH